MVTMEFVGVFFPKEWRLTTNDDVTLRCVPSLCIVSGNVYFGQYMICFVTPGKFVLPTSVQQLNEIDRLGDVRANSCKAIAPGISQTGYMEHVSANSCQAIAPNSDCATGDGVPYVRAVRSHLNMAIWQYTHTLKTSDSFPGLESGGLLSSSQTLSRTGGSPVRLVCGLAAVSSAALIVIPIFLAINAT